MSISDILVFKHSKTLFGSEGSEEGDKRGQVHTHIVQLEEDSYRQPGDLRETHGFPSLPRDRFGVVREC